MTTNEDIFGLYLVEQKRKQAEFVFLTDLVAVIFKKNTLRVCYRFSSEYAYWKVFLLSKIKENISFTILLTSGERLYRDWAKEFITSNEVVNSHIRSQGKKEIPYLEYLKKLQEKEAAQIV